MGFLIARTLRKLSEKQERSRMSQILNRIDWAPIRSTLEEMYDNMCELSNNPSL
jgi:hypothetical protein